jgi:lipopolysaccharide biosynthesis regulator YciM
MRDTLPFAPVALRELAAFWQKQLSEIAPTSDGGELRSRLAHVYLQIFNTDPDPAFQGNAAEQILSLHDMEPIDASILERVSEIAKELGDATLERRALERLAACEDTKSRQDAKERLGEIFEQAGNRNAAVESWRAAAQLCETSHDEQDHARSLYERLLDAAPCDGDAARRLAVLYAECGEWNKVPELVGVVLRSDCERGSELLLQLAPRALEDGIRGGLLAMIDEAVAWLPPSSAWVHELQRVKARALAAPPARYAEACDALRTLVDTFGSEDDVREYEAFVASIPDGDQRHDERRFLYRWRAAHDAQPAAVLLSWAQDEEAHGALEEAVATYERLVQIAPEADRAPVAFKMAQLLVDLGRPDDARSWLRRAVECPADANPERLSAILRGAIDFPDELVLWQKAEAIARELGQLDVVVCAYGEVIARGDVGAELGDALGRRVVALEGECNVEPSFFVDVLHKVLELAPSARWSLDRLKVTLSSQERWEDLFRLYDRAIDATATEGERAALLAEAAVAARDLADDAERAIGYLASIHALNPEDGAVSTSLERLYERQGRQRDLVGLLTERAARSDGAARQQFQHRIAALRLDLGQVVEASAVVEAILDEGAAIADVAGLLERLAPYPEQGRAVDRLLSHYESLGRLDDAVRLAKAGLERAKSADERAQRVCDLVRLRVSASHASHGVRGAFARVMAAFEPELVGKPALTQHVYKAVFASAIAALRSAPTDLDFEDAADGAWRAVGALKSALLKAGDTQRAARLLERAAGLPLDPDRRRELLEQAVQLCSESSGDPKQAIRLYSVIFEEYASHPFAAASLDRFAGLLEAAGENHRLAQLWERQAQLEADADQGTIWLRAAVAWERASSGDRAVAAYERAAAAGSEASLEALARIYLDRSQRADAVRVLERLRALVPPERGRGGHSLRLSDAYGGLGRRDLARSCLEEALGDEPTFALADEMRARLIEFYRCDGDWAPLASTLSDAGLRSESPKQKVAYLREAAEVLRGKLDQPAAAAATLELALSAAPRDTELQLELARMLESLQQWPRAAEVLRECIATSGESSPKDRASLYQRLARALRGASDLEGALAQLQVAARLQPTDPQVLTDLGRLALDVSRLDVAASAYRALLLVFRNPSAQADVIARSQVILSLSRIARLRGDPRHAADLLDSALEEALDAGEDHDAFERALVEMGRPELVAATLERRIERTPSLAVRASTLGHLVDLWNRHLARNAELGGRIGLHAEQMLRELADEGAPGGAVWLALWSVLTRLEDDPSAAFRRLPQSEGLFSVLQDAVATMEPGIDRARLHVIFARALIAKSGSGDEAIRLLSSAQGDLLDCVGPDAPEFVEAARALGDALERAGRRDDALQHYESILDRRPTRGETVRMVADRLEALGSGRLADCYELWMTLDPEAMRLAPRLVDLRAAQGDAGGTVRALTLGLTADPTNRAFVDGLAQHYEEQGDWPAVARVLGPALDTAPGDRALLLRIVDAHTRAWETEEVLRLLDGAIARAQRDPELLHLRAGAREVAGDDAGAVADLLAISKDAGSVDLVVEMLTRIVERSASRAGDTYAIALVDVLIGAARVEHAQRVLDRLLTRNPRHAGALERTAALAAPRGHWDRTADAYSRLLQILVGQRPADPGHLAEVGLAFADACERAGRPGAARVPLESVLRTQPEIGDLAGQSADAGLAWSRLLAKVGRASEALSVLVDVVARNRGKRLPELGALYLEIGKAYLATDDLLEAFNVLRSGFAVDPRCTELALVFGLLASDLDDDKTAERALVTVAMATARDKGSSASAVAAQRVRALCQLAAMADAKGEVAKAQRWATAAAREDPAHAEARALLNKVGPARQVGGQSR